MNVYDFDKTIYDGDSTVDFYCYCLKKHFNIIKFVPIQLKGIILYKLKIISKTEMKEYFYSFFKEIKNIDKDLEEFWNIKKVKIKKWYLNQQKEDDVIISASPYFLLLPICKILEIHSLIASNVNKETGKYNGLNCRGQEKVKRFYEEYENGKIQKFYSDSYSDAPLAEIAEEAFLVKKNEIKKWTKGICL